MKKIHYYSELFTSLLRVRHPGRLRSQRNLQNAYLIAKVQRRSQRRFRRKQRDSAACRRAGSCRQAEFVIREVLALLASAAVGADGIVAIKLDKDGPTATKVGRRGARFVRGGFYFVLE